MQGAAGVAWSVLGAWLAVSLVLNLAWELAQLPLYTLWHEAVPGAISWAVAHCTASDVGIALGSYVATSMVLRWARWPWRAPRSGLARNASRHCVKHLRSARAGAHQFLAAISFITSLSRLRSASILLSRAFSVSNCRSRLTSSEFMAPKRLRHV